MVGSALLALGAIWVAVGAVGLRSDLGVAAAELRAARQAVSDGDLDAARADVARARSAALDAEARAESPVWRAYSHLPLIGTLLDEVRSVTGAATITADEVLPRLVEVDVRPARWEGRLDTRPLVRAQQPLQAASAALLRARAMLVEAPDARIGALTRARTDLDESLRSLARTVGEAYVAAQVVPALAGEDRARRYFLGLQNLAEGRGTGGIIATFAILRADKGRLTLERVGSTQDLVDPATPVLSLGAEYDRRYARFETTRTWRSANLSSDLPTVGPLLRALWQRQSGDTVDGVILADPVAFGLLLGATGPVAVPGGLRLSEANAAEFLMSGVYRRLPGTSSAQEMQRNAVFQAATKGVFDRLTRPGVDVRRLVDRVGRAAGSGHLQVWSAEPRLQEQLRRSRAGGALLASGPYLEVVTVDAGGTKLDVHQRRDVTYVGRPTGEAVDLGAGPELEEEATVTVRITNGAPAGLPPYVTTRRDAQAAPAGQSRSMLSVYLARRATLLRATLDGRPVVLESQTENGLAVFSTFLTIDAGRSATLVMEVRQPATPTEPLRYRQQPRATEDRLDVRRQGAPVPVERVYASASG